MTREFWSGKKVLVTGGAGFIGSRVVSALAGTGVTDVVVPRSSSCDLRVMENCRRVVAGCDVVIHLAAPTGGISFSRAHPASQYRDCMQINLNLLESARKAGVAKFVSLGNLLAYPLCAPSPLREDSLQDGAIASTHLGIGLAKRDMVVLAEMYHREYGMSVVNVLAANAYGPGDDFDSEHTHVIPATIKKCFHEKKLVVWGDGSPTRDFLYVDDVARGILLAAEKLESPHYVNLASGTEISIGELVRLIAQLSGFTGPIEHDLTKAGGDPRRLASPDMARDLLGFEAEIDLRVGLERTIAWYMGRSGT